MTWDAVVVGAGPNGLAAAIELARAGASVKVLERHPRPGGGTRSEALTRPGFVHDVCSAAHPMGVLSPFLRKLPLEDHGLEWVFPDISVAHPLPDQPAVLLHPSIEQTARELDPEDRAAWIRTFAPFVERSSTLLEDALGPLGLPRDPMLLARFGLLGLRSASGLARARFRGPRARALLAGCAAHAFLPLEHALTAAVGMMFVITGHTLPWPVVRGGTENLTRAMVRYAESLGVEVETEVEVSSLDAVPDSRVVLFDTDPGQLARIAGDALPAAYRWRLERFRYGPGAFKVDYALDGPIPWTDPEVRRACTIHLAGPIETVEASERAMWAGERPLNPFVLLVQQSAIDPSRAPSGQHTGYAYIHVPADSKEDHTEALERQIERFAPGFGARVLARHTTRAADWAGYNPNWVGGAITGGVADLLQTFNRPITRLDPYRTPNPRLLLCSASTPPGGGVHGMCGYHAARSALRRLGRA